LIELLKKTAMKNKLFSLTIVILTAGIVSMTAPLKKLYDFKAKTIEGKQFDMNSLKGKKVLVVNTASKCGFTPQYKELEELFKTYGGDKFTIIGFPANNFGKQEPGSNTEIKEFCTKNYGVTFQMMEKISVTGEDMDPLYKWLASKAENGKLDAPVKWNFQKFMIDENGQVVDVAMSNEVPNCDKIVNWIKGKK
jgi:glutathione peroxidase